MTKKERKKSAKKKSAVMASHALAEDGREQKITEANIVDDFCHYSYEIVRGKHAGDTHSVKGSGLIKEHLREAFVDFNVHLAILDDAFKLAGIEVTSVSEVENHEITLKYQVTGFKIRGSSSVETIQLIGSKYSQTACGRIPIVTPKIALDSLSHYQWYNELNEAAQKAREYVTQYAEGDFIPVETEEETFNPNQLTIADAASEAQEGIPAGDDDTNENTELDKDFAEAAL